MNINSGEVIAGYCIDSNGAYLGFQRTPDGAFAEFAAPGAGTGAQQGTVTAGFAGLNDAGTITGYYFDSNTVPHGYVRAPDGSFATFDPLGSYKTYSTNVNSLGEITGWYQDANNVSHGYVRSPNGR